MIGAFKARLGLNVIASIIASAFFLAAGFILGKLKERRAVRPESDGTFLPFTVTAKTL